MQYSILTVASTVISFERKGFSQKGIQVHSDSTSAHAIPLSFFIIRENGQICKSNIVSSQNQFVVRFMV